MTLTWTPANPRAQTTASQADRLGTRRKAYRLAPSSCPYSHSIRRSITASLAARLAIRPRVCLARLGILPRVCLAALAIRHRVYLAARITQATNRSRLAADSS